MCIHFESDELRRLYEDPNCVAPQFGPDLIKAFRKKVGFLEAATSELDLRSYRALRFEKLVGDRAGKHSIRLNDQWRLILRLESEPKGRVLIIIELTTTERRSGTMTTTLTPAEVFPPGEYLRDELEERGWTVTEFAEIIGRPVQAVSEILNGKKEITTETACALSDALGTTPDLWLNLQTNYRLFEQRTRSAPDSLPSPVARRARLRNLIPLAKARARGWVPNTNDLDVLERAVTQLLEIESLDARPAFALAARRANSTEPITLEQIAWLAHVRTVAAKQKVAAFEPEKLATLALDVPRLTQDGPSKLRLLRDRFAACGVALVFAEGLQGGKLDGAVTFLSDGRPVIALTTRGDRFDSVLFTLLHECAHLALGHISPGGPVIVDDDLMSAQTDPKEIAANDQALNWLFPGGYEITSTSVQGILDAACRYEVHPSVVIGRIQRDTGDWRRHRSRIPKVRPYLAEAGLMS